MCGAEEERAADKFPVLEGCWHTVEKKPVSAVLDKKPKMMIVTMADCMYSS